jgi:hypothetical protein
MAALALLLHLRRGSQVVHTVAGTAVGRPHFGSREHELPVLAGHEFFVLDGMARAAQRRHLVRSSHAIWGCGTLSSPVLFAASMAGVAAQSGFEVRMVLEIGHLFGMAGGAELMALLCGGRQ